MEVFRIWRSPFIDYHAPLAPISSRDTEIMKLDEKSYSDEILQSIAENGFNGIWVHALLQELVKHPLFPEFGEDAELFQEKLRVLIGRAKRYGIKVYLQMQPPRAVSGRHREFWEHHKDCAGSVEIIDWEDLKEPTPMISLCTSTAKVRQYLREAMAALGASLPDLGGYIIISASEYPAHCRTREKERLKVLCPRCGCRPAAEVIADLLNDLYRGMRSGSPTQQLIAWNWDWSTHAGEKDVISRLDPGIVPMADFERGGRMTLMGRPGHLIDEYALCYPGPAERFLESRQAAVEHHAPFAVKFQLGTTHENGAVPALPVIPNIFTRAEWFRKHDCAGFLGCWNFGNFPTVNTAAFNFFLKPETPDSPEEAMAAFARHYFPGCRAERAVSAWKLFAEAMTFYPHIWKFLYYAPTSWALGYFVPPGPMSGKAGATWLKDAPRGDDLALAMPGPFTLEELISAITRLCQLWEEGVKAFESSGIGKLSGQGALEYGNTVVCGACFKSLLYMLKLYKLKRDTGSAEGEAYREISRAELANAERALPFVEADPRQGFHAEAQQYNFSAPMIREKIRLLHEQL